MVELVDYGAGAERTATRTEDVVDLDPTGRAAVVIGGTRGIEVACAGSLSGAGRAR
jgi:NAD(P)H-nitrite reductase large subunit